MARIRSIEDGNLSSTIRTSRISTFNDIDLTFEKKPSGDIYKKSDAAAVKQSVKNIISTNRLEKPFEPAFGADVTGMLFELATSGTSFALKEQIKNAIFVYEPRAEIINIDCYDRDDNSLYVRVTFTVVSTREQVSVETTLTRLR